MRVVILGLSITSSWGNGHATTFRGLVKAMAARGHDVLFLERDVPWYAANRDLPVSPHGRTALYHDSVELHTRHEAAVRDADLVIVGSYVPDGIEVGCWAQVTARGTVAFYDIDTPVTLAALDRADCAYLDPATLRGYDLYLSFSGGPALGLLERRYGAKRARPLYCAVDPELYYPEPAEPCWDLGYMGTYSADRQPALERLLLEPARRLPECRFVVAGPQYPDEIEWPANVERIEHLPPAQHRRFYNAQRFSLNITRADMLRLGYSPSVRLFEAAACATPVIGDRWEGIEQFFTPGASILIADSADGVVDALTALPDAERRAVGERARSTVLAGHTAAHRVAALEGYLQG